MGALKELILSKLSLRILYIVGAFSASHIVAVLESSNFLAYSHAAGFAIKITDPKMFENWLTGILLVGGEYVYSVLHSKFVMPIVSPDTQPTPAAIGVPTPPSPTPPPLSTQSIQGDQNVK